TITKLDYGSAGQQKIGGFELGIDDGHPPENGEISMGGDSGSAWMATDASGKATDMMLGLHFAGETVGPAEYAVACYPASVFEKLEIRPPVVAGAGPGAVAAVVSRIGGGYDADFLAGQLVPVPTAATTAVEQDYAPTKAGDTVRHYTHFSLA